VANENSLISTRLLKPTGANLGKSPLSVHFHTTYLQDGNYSVRAILTIQCVENVSELVVAGSEDHAALMAKIKSDLLHEINNELYGELSRQLEEVKRNVIQLERTARVGNLHDLRQWNDLVKRIHQLTLNVSVVGDIKS
jgi:hypothetical protein